jgi:hypothetical protein
MDYACHGLTSCSYVNHYCLQCSYGWMNRDNVKSIFTSNTLHLTIPGRKVWRTEMNFSTMNPLSGFAGES